MNCKKRNTRQEVWLPVGSNYWGREQILVDNLVSLEFEYKGWFQVIFGGYVSVRMQGSNFLTTSQTPNP